MARLDPLTVKAAYALGQSGTGRTMWTALRNSHAGKLSVYENGRTVQTLRARGLAEPGVLRLTPMGERARELVLADWPYAVQEGHLLVLMRLAGNREGMVREPVYPLVGEGSVLNALRRRGMARQAEVSAPWRGFWMPTEFGLKLLALLEA